MTKDLMLIAEPKVAKWAGTEDFIDAVSEKLRVKLSA
jgi:hypothetical protein